MNGNEVLSGLAERYRGLYLPVEEGMSRSGIYKEYVLSGKGEKRELPGFLGDEKDTILSFPTPEGEVEVIYLEKEKILNCFFRKLPTGVSLYPFQEMWVQ